MGIEAGDVIVEIDPIPADDTVIAIDPIEFVPVAEPIPAEWTADGSTDLPPDAQTFGGPVDVAVDPVPVDDTPVISDENMAELQGEWSTEFQPKDDSATDVPADDGSSVPVDDGMIYTTMFIDGSPVEDSAVTDTPADGSSEVVIDRPVDPEPNWRTLDGPTDGAPDAGTETGGEGSVGEGGSTDETPVLDKDITDDTGTTDGTDPDVDVIYTLDPSDPLIYANTAVDDTPGRPTDPLPFERTNAIPATDPAAPETASDVVHYAAAEPFHTGLDLL